MLTDRDRLASYPGREGGGKAVWYQLHAHALSTPTKAGPPNMTEYFPYFSPVHISKLLHVIQTAIVSDSTALRVFYLPKDDATKTSPFPKRVKVAGSHLVAPSLKLLR